MGRLWALSPLSWLAWFLINPEHIIMEHFTRQRTRAVSSSGKSSPGGHGPGNKQDGDKFTKRGGEG